MKNQTKFLMLIAVAMVATAILVNFSTSSSNSKRRQKKEPTSTANPTALHNIGDEFTQDDTIDLTPEEKDTSNEQRLLYIWQNELQETNIYDTAIEQRAPLQAQDSEAQEQTRTNSKEPPIFEKLRKSKEASIPKEVRDLAGEITKDLSSKREKAKAIYDWLTSNIVYDTEEWEHITKGANEYTHDHDPLSVLKRGSTVCIGYAWLFDAMCESVGVDSTWLIGDVRGYRATPDDEAISDFRHAWNAVQNDDGTWSLLDATWGAIQEGDNSESAKSRQSYYFDTPANQFIFDHLPEDESWQLLEVPLQSETAFARLPNLKPTFFTSNLKLGGNYTSDLKAASNQEALFFYSAPQDVNVAITLGTTSKSEESKELKTISSPDGTKAAAILPALTKGEYILRIYSGKRTSSTLECSADFIINIE